jgi:CRISPR-associated exonuclease Cas4
VPTFTELGTAAYCPRQLYYRRKHDDGEPPAAAGAVRELAFRYPELLEPATDLTDEPIAVAPAAYRTRLGATRDRLDCWGRLVDPAARDRRLSGKDCRGLVHKVITDPPRPVVVSPGRPPDRGVWTPQAVRATAAAKALAWERERAVDVAIVEYPAHGVVRRVRLTTRRKAAYRRALSTAESLDGPPPRLEDDDRCAACEYREECGTRTRSLRSRLSL